MVNLGDDIITRYRQREGYFTPIANEFIQRIDMYLEAQGLLAHLLSYSSNFKVYKTELFTRFDRHGRTSITKVWNQLVEEGYIIQLKIRKGKRYSYTYLFDEYPFAEESIRKIYADAKKIDENYCFHFGGNGVENFDIDQDIYKRFPHLTKNNARYLSGYTKEERIGHRQKLKIDNKDNKKDNMVYNNKDNFDIKKDNNIEYNISTVDFIQSNDFSSVENQQSKKHDDINDSWSVENEQFKNFSSVDFEQSILNCSKRTPTKYSINEIDDDDIYSNSDFSNLGDHDFDLDSLLNENEILRDCYEYLINSGVDNIEGQKIIFELNKDKRLLDPDLIISQLEWCISKQQVESISNFSVYFINGLRMKYNNSKTKRANEAKNRFLKHSAKDNSLAGFKLPNVNWE